MHFASRHGLPVSQFVFHIIPFMTKTEAQYHCQSLLSFFKSYSLTLEFKKDFKQRQPARFLLLLQ